MSHKYSILFGILFSVFFTEKASAQYDQSSYSIIGLGNLNWSGYSHNVGMGGLGVTYNSKYFLNHTNPALAASNYEAVFQAGGTFDYRSVSNNTENYSTTTGGFKDLGFNLPIVAGKWNVGLSLNPYSSVNYGFTQSNPGGGPDGNDVSTLVSGTGGLDELAFANGIKFKNLYLGLEASLIFGSINKVDQFQLGDPEEVVFGTTVVDTRRSYSSVSTTLGFVYKLPTGENKWLNIGGYYTPDLNLRQNSLVTFENRSSGGNILSADTLVYDNALKRTVALPAKISGGISYEVLQKLAIGVDFQYQDWSSFRDIDGQAITSYTEAFRIAVGGEIIPDFETNKLSNVISYRFGVHLERTPFLINEQNVNDVGINFGASLPLNAFWGLSHMNLGVTLGQRGNVENGLVRENYVKINFGFSLQDITWFTRTRFN